MILTARPSQTEAGIRQDCGRGRAQEETRSIVIPQELRKGKIFSCGREQWLSGGRVLDLRSKGPWFETLGRQYHLLLV